jgi:hypothetical protein
MDFDVAFSSMGESVPNQTGYVTYNITNKKPALVRFRGEAWRVLLSSILLIVGTLPTGIESTFCNFMI